MHIASRNFGGEGASIVELTPKFGRGLVPRLRRDRHLWLWMSRMSCVAQPVPDLQTQGPCLIHTCMGVLVSRDPDVTNQMKRRSERRKHCTLAVVRRSRKCSPRRRPPSRGRGTAKIQSAGDGHYLYLQTQFGEDPCTQFRVIVVTDPRTNTQTQPQIHKYTDRTDYNTLRR